MLYALAYDVKRHYERYYVQSISETTKESVISGPDPLYTLVENPTYSRSQLTGDTCSESYLSILLRLLLLELNQSLFHSFPN